MILEKSEMAQDAANIADVMFDIGRRARDAARHLASAPTEQKNEALLAAARNLYDQLPIIRDANHADLTLARENGMTPAYIDRLTLD